MESEERLPLPRESDFPPGTEFVIKEFDVPLVNVPGQGWFNWFGGTPTSYNPANLDPDNNWTADSFATWLEVLRDSLPRT